MCFAYRFSFLCTLVLEVTLLVSAQSRETDFPLGPRYLVTTPSTLFLQPIATPSMSATQMFGMVSPQTGQAEPITINGEPANLPAIFWGWTSPGQTTIWAVYSSALATGLPAGFVDVGVSAIVTAEWFEEHQRNSNVAEASRYWKTHTNRATHLYTNADIDRLRAGGKLR
jgi:hypothetical protein